MIRASMRYIQCLNGVIARSANSVPQFKKPVICSLAPSVGGTLLQSKMYASYSGSFSQPALPTAEVTTFVKDVKKDVEKAAKRQFPEFTPVLFCQQGDSEGTHYHVKVQTDPDPSIWIHVCVVSPTEGPVRFDGFVDHQAIDDPIRPSVCLPKIGGYSDVQLATPDIVNKAGKLKDAVEKASGVSFSEFKAVLYRVQLVAGFNYMVKVQTSSDVYLHMTMFEGLSEPMSVELGSYKYPKTREDPLV